MERIYPGIRRREKCDEEDSYLVTFRKVKVNVTYQKNGEWITASVAQLLQDAYLAAEEMQDAELVINEQNKPDDLNLWTEEELLEDKETVRELENKTQLDKLYVRENSSSSAEPSSPHLKRGINEVDEEGKPIFRLSLAIKNLLMQSNFYLIRERMLIKSMAKVIHHSILL